MENLTPQDQELNTPEKALTYLAELTSAIKDDSAERGKALEGIAKVMEAVHALRADMLSKMRFDAGVTKDLIADGGMRKAMLAPTTDPRLKRLQSLSDDVHIVDGILGYTKKVKHPYGGMKSLDIFGRWDAAQSEFGKAMDTATAAGGAEWVPGAMLSAEMQYAVEIEQKVLSLFPSFVMPHETFNWPILTSLPTAHRKTETTDIDSVTKVTASVAGTSKTQFDAEKFMARIGWSGELEEAAIVAMLPELKKALVLAHAHAKDYATIDGQITSVIDSGDDPSGTATDVRNCWDGIRWYCDDASTTVDLGSAWTVEGLNSVRKLLGKTGLMPGRLAWIPGISTYYNLLTIKDENDANVMLPVSAYGGAATILTGELGKIYGIPVVPSEYIREDLNASGIYDDVTKTKTVLPIVYRDGWKYGSYGDMQVRASDELYIESDALVVVTRERGDLQYMFADTVQIVAALGYNIAP
jgi:HK97 family phage major capsid protein